MIRSLVGIMAANALLAALGAGLLLTVGAWARTTPLARIGLSLFAGLAGFTALVPVLLYLGLAPTPPVTALLALVFVALGFWLERRRGETGRDGGGGGIVLAAFAAVPLLLLAARAVVKPLWIGDAILDWTLKAKVLYYQGGAFTGALDERFFTSEAYPYAHLEYPLGLPSLEAFAFHAMGGMDTRVLHLQFVFLLGAFAATMWALLRPHVDATVLGAAVLAVLMVPAVHTRLLTGYADVPVAVYWVAGALAIGLWLAGEGRDRLVLGSLFAAAALATKVEGMLFDAVLFGGAGVALAAARDWRRLRDLMVAAAAVLATAVPWRLFNARHDLANPAFDPSPAGIVDRLDTLPTILSALARNAVGESWLYLFPIALAAAALALARGPEARRLALGYLAAVAGLFAGLVLVYLTTVSGRDLQALLEQSAARVITTPLLLSCAALPPLLERALAPTAATDRLLARAGALVGRSGAGARLGRLRLRG